MTVNSVGAAKSVDLNPFVATTTQTIPFRKDSVTTAPEVLGLLLTTLLLVAVFAATALYARRRGWLDRWVGPKPSLQNNNRKIIVLESQSISQKTTLHRVSVGDNEILLAESAMQIQLAHKAINKEPGHD